jgi:large conductance mechanosensitive channel
MWKDFKAFLLRGNIVELAVAVVVGGAFNAIISSLIKDIITPWLLRPIMTTLHAERWEDLAWRGALWGRFFSSVLEFIVTAFVLFLVVRALSAAQRRARAAEAPPAEAAPPPPAEVMLLTDIRDLLRRDRAAQ